MPLHNVQFRTVLISACGLLYPFVVYFGVSKIPPVFFILAALCFLSARVPVLRKVVGELSWVIFAISALLLLLIMMFNPVAAVKSYPVIASLTAASLFGTSLLKPPSLIERIARLREPALPPEGVIYTRKVTIIWTGFLLLNAAISASTALWGNMEAVDAVEWAFILSLHGTFVLWRTRSPKAYPPMTFLPLSQLLQQGRPNDYPVARRNGTNIPFRALRKDALSIATQFRGRRVVLACTDSYHYAVGLFGLLHGGAEIILPPNTLPTTLLGLKDHFDCMVDDNVIASTNSEAHPLSRLDGTKPSLHFFTSGSTGVAKQVTKSLSMFEAETVSAHKLWGNAPENCAVFHLFRTTMYMAPVSRFSGLWLQVFLLIVRRQGRGRL